MERIFIFLQLVCLAFGQGSVDAECPLPGGPATSSVDECSKYSACIWSGTQCLMRDDAGYVTASAPVDTGRGFTVDLQLPDPAITLFDADILNAVFEVIYHEDYHVQIKIYDPANSRYEVPFPVNVPDAAGTAPLYAVTTSDVGSPFSFTISRSSNGNSIFNSYGPITFENQFIQITTTLDTSYLYGFGENSHTTFRHQFSSRKTFPMFGRDQPPGLNDFNQYGVQPYYVNIEDDSGNTHSVLYYSSNAMEYSTFSLTDGTPAVTLRTIGGIIDMHFFLGPTPEDVNVQYAKAIGKSAFPPYYALGFHLSRYGYNTLDNLKIVRQRMKDAGIPQDFQTCDIDYMENNRDFTYDNVNWNGFPEFIDEIHNDGAKVTLMLDPALVVDLNYPSYVNGQTQDVFVKWMSSDLVPADQLPEASDYVIGYVWPDYKTVFPDFFKPETATWWTGECSTLHDTLPFDALWIDMNEPANFGTNMDRPFNYPSELPDWSLKCPFTSLDSPPFPTKASYHDANDCKRISDKTICMSSLHNDGTNSYLHYDVHSMYGLSESAATYVALDTVFPGKRHLILSRATYPGSGKYVAHWLGDNAADWTQMAMSVIGMLEFNLFVIPNVGADICGFFGDTTRELCARWMQLGAFYPFSRNHNTMGAADQDPAAPALNIADISRDVLLLRYQYLPYLYTLFHDASMRGNSVVRPLFNIFPSDLPARDVDDQFFWGTMMMIAPVLKEGAVTRSVYFPQGLWYNLVDGTLSSSGSETITVDAPLEVIPVYARGGSILPFQVPDVTTTASRLNPFGLTIALDEAGTASGELFWDDGESVHVMSETYLSTFDFASNQLNMTIQYDVTSVSGLNIETIKFYGYDSNPSNIDVNGSPLDVSQWSFDATSNVLVVTPSIPLDQEFLLVLS